MTNCELREAVKIYWNVKNKLDNLQTSYSKNSFQLKVITKLEPIIREKFKQSAVIHRQVIQDKYYHPDREIAVEEESNSHSKWNSDEVKREVAYLELKLEVIKNLLGSEIITELEKNEREQILGNGKQHKSL